MFTCFVHNIKTGSVDYTRITAELVDFCIRRAVLLNNRLAEGNSFVVEILVHQQKL